MKLEDRRRHPRVARSLPVALRIGGSEVAVEVADVGRCGIFAYTAPLPLATPVVVVVDDLRLSGRVVRVRLGGRERGVPARSGIAIALDVDDAALLSRWEGIVR